MEQFLQGNVTLRHLLNEKTLFMASRRSAIKEVNDDWAFEDLLPAFKDRALETTADFSNP